MQDATIVTALKARRTDVASKLRELTDALAHLDATIKLFQPGYHAPKMARGGLTRPLLDTLREADAPMTCKELAERIGATPKAVGIALVAQRKRGLVVSEVEGREMVWRVA